MSPIGYKNVTCFHNQDKLEVKAVVLKSGPSVFWRFVSSIFSRFWLLCSGSAGLRPTDLIRQRDNDVSNKVVVNIDAPPLAYKGYDDDSFTQKIEELKGYLASQEGKMFDIPLSTKVHGELHMIHLVIDEGNRKIYFIDPKGYKPTDVRFYDSMNRAYTGKTCMDLIVDLGNRLDLEDCAIEICANFQAVMDCVPASEAVVRQLAEMSPGQRDLAAAVNEVHQNYRQKVDILRTN